MSRYRIVLVVEIEASGVELGSVCLSATEPLRVKKYDDERNAQQQSYAVSGTQLPAPRIASFEVIEAKKL